MTSAEGVVLVVSVAPLGDELIADALAGDVTIVVLDAADFSEDGGTVRVGGPDGEVVNYDSCDDAAGVLTLSTGLFNAWPSGSRVDLFDPIANVPGVESRALVQLPGDDANDDALDAVVTHALVPMLPEGVREPNYGESVRVTQAGSEWVVTEIVGRVPQVAGELIRPGSIPQEALSFTIDGVTTTVGAEPTDPATGDIWFDGANGYVMRTWDGVQWVVNQFDTPALAANSVKANQIDANAIVAGKILAGAIDTMALSSVNIQGNMTDGTIRSTDFIIDADDGKILVYSQTNPVLLVAGDSVVGTRSVVVPAGVTRIKVEAWGGGGGGAGDGGTRPSDAPAYSSAGCGGGGGEYACEPSLTVAPGDTINYTVGRGGAGGTSANGSDGTATTVNRNGLPTLITANPGRGGRTNNSSGTGRAGGAGGSGSSNGVHFSGGVGANLPNWEIGGGGGAGAGANTNGLPATSAVGAGATGTGGGGSGSAGVGADANAATAATPGGGGGGGGFWNTHATTGGAGGAGRVKITYYTTTLSASIASMAGVDPVTGKAYPAGISDAARPPVVDTGWLSFTGVTGWTVTGGFPWQARQIGNVVYLRGGMVNATYTGAYSTVGQLPAGITAPLSSQVFSGMNNTTAVSTFLLTTAGALQVYRSAASGSGMYLSGANYLTD